MPTIMTLLITGLLPLTSIALEPGKIAVALEVLNECTNYVDGRGYALGEPDRGNAQLVIERYAAAFPEKSVVLRSTLAATIAHNFYYDPNDGVWKYYTPEGKLIEFER